MRNWARYLLPAMVVLVTPTLEAANNPELSLDFLEFLAEWETQDGEWLDPQLLDPAGSDTGNVGDTANEGGNEQ